MLNEQELRQLIERAYAIARACVKRNDPEYLSEAHDALLHALDTYKPSLNVPLSAWITLIVRQRMVLLRRRESRWIQKGDAYWETVHDPSFIHPIHELLDDLPPRDRLTAKLHWIDDMPIIDVARQLGEHHQVTRLRINRIRNELREAIYGQG